MAELGEAGGAVPVLRVHVADADGGVRGLERHDVVGRQVLRGVTLDLSPYAGKTIELAFNTRASPPPTPGVGPRSDERGDMPLWGEPRVVVR